MCAPRSAGNAEEATSQPIDPRSRARSPRAEAGHRHRHAPCLGFYLRGTVRGRTIFESAGTDNRALAEEARSARETELYRAAIFGEKKVAEPIRFNVAAHSYLTNQEHSVANRARVGRVVAHFGAKVTCDAIRQAEVDAACAKLCRADAQPATKLREVVAPVKAILTHAARRGWCSVPVFERMKSAGKRTEWFTPEQAEAMIVAAPPNAAAWLTFFFCTGARVNETIRLEWQDVDLQHARAVLRDTKNGDDRNVDLPPRAVAMLASMSPARRAAVCFATSAAFRTGRPRTAKPSPTAVNSGMSSPRC